ncbi:MFS transporter [Effusibacillus pohliae]|uniref:MFS transporter n=1 Tax=Effusibacillus pohliae TaxID=232270 RepID=UPI0003808B5D|nr:MFS transporter [Effusibacillus pohliae]
MWKNRNVWIVLAGELIAGLGLWTSIIANLEFMQRHVPSDFLKSLILAAGLLAGVLVGPYAGNVIDSSRKKTVLLYAGLGRMVSVCFMFLALSFESVWWMVLFAVTLQVAAAFYFPALQSVIPLIVKDQDLLSLNGVHMNVATVARILGTALAGLMLAVMSLSALYAASLVAYACLLFATFFLRVDEQKLAERRNRTAEKTGFRDMFPVLRQFPVAVMVLVLTVIPSEFIGGFNLMVIRISEMQNDPQVKGLLYAVEGVCFVLGSFLVKKWANGREPVKLLLLFAGGIAVAHLSLALADHRWTSLLSFGLFGLCAGLFFPLVSTLFQKQIPREYHGRFFSFRNMMDRVLFQIVLLATGLCLDTIGFAKMVLLFGTISFCITIYYALGVKKRLLCMENPEIRQQT